MIKFLNAPIEYSHAVNLGFSILEKDKFKKIQTIEVELIDKKQSVKQQGSVNYLIVKKTGCSDKFLVMYTELCSKYCPIGLQFDVQNDSVNFYASIEIGCKFEMEYSRIPEYKVFSFTALTKK